MISGGACFVMQDAGQGAARFVQGVLAQFAGSACLATGQGAVWGEGAS